MQVQIAMQVLHANLLLPYAVFRICLNPNGRMEMTHVACISACINRSFLELFESVASHMQACNSAGNLSNWTGAAHHKETGAQR